MTQKRLSRAGADWTLIAEREPFFGVLSSPEFRADALSEVSLHRFFVSGREDISRVRAWCLRDLGEAPSGGLGLDIGCGVGRLTHAMGPFVSEVVGYDVADPMLNLARKAPAEFRCDNARFVSALPQGPVDWLLSYIVFQHIPPPEGVALLSSALQRAAEGAVATIHVTIGRETALAPARGGLSAWLEAFSKQQARRRGAVERLITMYDYDLSEIAAVFLAAGFARQILRPTNHGGHFGVWIIAKKGDAD